MKGFKNLVPKLSLAQELLALVIGWGIPEKSVILSVARELLVRFGKRPGEGFQFPFERETPQN